MHVLPHALQCNQIGGLSMLFRRKILVSGIVQGVGFRPFCARLAEKLALSGFVRNTSGGVEIELAGTSEKIDWYMELLSRENPPASVITSLAVLEEEEIFSLPKKEFNILESRREEQQLVLIPPDLSICDECLAELKDPSNRRFRYPFINCTNCGPRYTIIRELPYDRPETTMAPFPMCPACSKEYHDHGDRRFHAQPNACFDCGPTVWLTDRHGKILFRGDEAIRHCSSLLDEGKIAAVKGIGGFHITCTPFNDEVVENLRSRKGRKDKPFAVMASSLEVAEEMAYIPKIARTLLRSPRKPIVLCCRRKSYPLSSLVAPGQRSIGILLPYSPLHYLLLEDKKALIMTSANFSDAPIVSDNEEALSSLKEIVDYFLFSDRDIHMPIDDSVATPLGASFFLIRRARGYTPVPMAVSTDTPVIFGAGAEMKSTFCLSRGKLLFPGQYLGDMKQRGTAAYYNRAISHFLSLYGFTPEYLVHDLHPQFLSTAAAMKKVEPFAGETLGVQHHHAHLAACLLENGKTEPAIGVIFDGTGYGTDGTIWGGEFLVGNSEKYVRAGHFLPSKLPGGDAAVREPWRYALNLLVETFGVREAVLRAEEIWSDRRAQIERILAVLSFSPTTTSCGRFFDGVSSLLRLVDSVSFDGQAAMALEGIAEGDGCTPFHVMEEEGEVILDWRPAIRWIVDNRREIKTSLIAGSIHSGLAEAVLQACCIIRKNTGIKEVALSGGVWQNRRLTASTVHRLRREGFIPLLHRLVPPNDECVSVGQVAIGAAQWKK